MDILITSLHVMVCIVLVLVVLLQRGKGADMGAMLGGGGSQTVFGGRGAGNFLTKTTAACAVIFMTTSLLLSYLGNLDADDLIFDTPAEESAPADSNLLEEVEEDLGEAAGAGAGALEEITPPAEPAAGADAEGGAEETPESP